MISVITTVVKPFLQVLNFRTFLKPRKLKKKHTIQIAREGGGRGC